MEKKANPNAKTSDKYNIGKDIELGWTPLHFAVEKGHFGITKRLLDNGAIPSAKPAHSIGELFNVTPLHLAIKNQRLDLFKLLLDHSIKFDEKATIGTNQTGWTPLHLAVKYGNLDFIAPLIKKGAKLNEKTTGGGPTANLTPLHLAIKDNRLDIVKLLIESGATITPSMINLAKGKIKQYLQNITKLPTQQTGKTGIKKVEFWSKDKPESTPKEHQKELF